MATTGTLRNTPRIMSLLLVPLVTELCSCARHPSVTLHNDSAQRVRAVVQIPSVVVIGFPTPSSRSTYVLAPGEQKNCSYSDSRRVQNYSPDCYLFLAAASGPGGTLYKLAYVLSRTTVLHINTRENELVVTSSDGAVLTGEPGFIYDLDDSLGPAFDHDAD